MTLLRKAFDMALRWANTGRTNGQGPGVGGQDYPPHIPGYRGPF